MSAAPGPAGLRTVALGDADVLSEDDPHAGERAAATVHLTPDAVLVGPWGGSEGDGPCGHCLALRWQRLRARAVRDALETGTPPVAGLSALPGLPGLPRFVLDAVTGLHRAATASRGTSRPGVGRVSRLDLATLRVETVDLLADPSCPSCPPARVVTVPEALVPRPRTSASLRLRAPESYALPAGALANPVCGVLGVGWNRDLASPTTASVGGLFVERGRRGLNDVAWSGKAPSFAASRDLAFLEGLERYAGTRPRGPREVVVDSLDNLGGTALDPRDCGQYPDPTYDRDPVLHRFSPAARIPWVWGYSLRDERPLLVPARSCYYAVGSGSDDFVFESSNGCAIGSCLEEAVLCGLLELVERDAFLLGWYGGAPMTQIDAGSIGSPGVAALLDRADLNGYDVRLLDNRVDLDVAVVTAVAERRDGGPGLLSFAAAAALDPLAAAEAALGETLTYLPHLAHDLRMRRAEVEAMADDFDRVTDLRDHALLFALPRSAVHARRYLEPARVAPFAELFGRPEPGTVHCDLLEDLGHVRDQLVAAGCDVVVVDQTTPEQSALGLRTVRTLAPGLLPIDFGWSRQRALQLPRLRTAFLRRSRSSAVVADQDIHRVPHPFP